MNFDYEDHERMLRFWAAIALFLAFLAIALGLAGCSILGETKTKILSPPAAPERTAKNEEDAKKVAGALTDKSRKAHQVGILPQSTDSGTLVALAEANETWVGSPVKRMNPDDIKSIAALIGAMQKQEEAYRADRAAWESKIDAMGRDVERYKTEAVTAGGVISTLKAWLFWGAVLVGIACFLCPGLLWVIVRFVGGRAKAHLVSTVQAVQEFREANRDAAPALDVCLQKYHDKSTKDLVVDIKTELKKKRVA